MASTSKRSKRASDQDSSSDEGTESFISTNTYNMVIRALYSDLPLEMKDFMIGHVVYVMFARKRRRVNVVERGIKYLEKYYPAVTTDMRIVMEAIYNDERLYRSRMTDSFKRAVPRLSQFAFQGPSCATSATLSEKDRQRLKNEETQLNERLCELSRQSLEIGEEISEVVQRIELVKRALAHLK